MATPCSTAAFDPRVAALALVAGGYNNPADMRTGMGVAGYRGQLAALAAVAEQSFRTGETDYLPAVSSDGGEAVMGGAEPWEYYGTERSASPGWVNRVTRLSIRELITLDTSSSADFISPTPTLMVHGRTDAYCSPEGAQAVYDRIGHPKDLLWLPTTNHIDLYDNPEFLTPALDRITKWLTPTSPCHRTIVGGCRSPRCRAAKTPSRRQPQRLRRAAVRRVLEARLAAGGPVGVVAVPGSACRRRRRR
ncbi:MAG TPA: alpha/beta hydrolase [Pseudonocardiaceae bacterium]